MVKLDVRDIPNDLLEYMQSIEVATNEGSVIILSELEYNKISHQRELTEEEFEELEDELLLEMANERLENSDPSTWISWEDVLVEHGYSEYDLSDWTEEDEADLA